jgi:hypothetical protein
MPGPITKDRLRWYDFVQVPNPMLPGGPVIATTPLPTPPAEFGPEISIGGLFITLSRITRDSRQELSATIVWKFSFTTPPGPQLALASQKMQFSIRRDDPLTGDLVCTVVDSGNISEINFNPTPPLLITQTVTTSFECTDTGIDGPTRRYFLTAAAGTASGFTVDFGGGGQPTPITTFNNPTITEVHFSGKVIGPNIKPLPFP